MNKMNTTKAEKIEQWKEKGVDWLCTQLWNARTQCHNARIETQHAEANYRSARAEISAAREVTRINENLAKVLEQNGIRPTRLRLTYMSCGAETHDYCDGDCDGCRDYIKSTGTYSYYDYDISEGKYQSAVIISGITAEFKRLNLDVLKVVDERTGEVIYQATDGEE